MPSEFGSSKSAKGQRRAASWFLAAASALALAACASPEQKVERYTRSGEDFLAQSDLPKASIQFQNALKIDETHVPAIEGLVAIAEQRTDYRAMFGALQRIVRLQPGNTAAASQLAKLYLLAGDSAEALATIDKAIAVDHTSAVAKAVKAAILFRVENFEQARALAEEALSLDPGSEDAASVLAADLIKSDDIDAALTVLETAITANSKSAILHLLRLETLKKAGRIEDLDGAYARLVETFPERSDYLRLDATRLYNEGRFAEARGRLIKAVEAEPDRVDSIMDVARLDYRVGGAIKAEETLRGFMEMRPGDRELQFAFASFLREQDRSEEALSVYRALAADKNPAPIILRAKNEMASLAILRGDFAAAKTIVAEILKSDSRNADGLVKRASILIAEGDTDSAVADLRIAMADAPESAQVRMLLATAYEVSGKTEVADAEYAQLFQRPLNKPEVGVPFASFLLRVGKTDRAERTLVETIAVDPGNADAIKMLAALRLQRQDWRGAEEAAELLRALEARDGVAEQILGAAYAGLGDYAGVIETLSKSDEIGPLARRPLQMLVFAYLETDRAAEAETLLRSVLQRSPGDYDASLMLARVTLRQGRMQEAERLLLAAIDREPARAEAYEDLYRRFVATGRLGEAAGLIDDGLARAPENEGLRILKADLSMALNDREAALAIYEDVLTRRPDDLIVLNNFASLLSELRTDDDSRRRAAAAAAPLADTQNGYFLDTYGWAQFRIGELDTAIAALERAVAAAPGLLDARYHLGVALMAAEAPDRAAPYLESVVANADAPAYMLENARRLLGRQQTE